VLTAVLLLTGLGFGPASMSYLLVAQEAVTFQQRGLVTSAITFFRSIGGALGIGVLGATFNALSRAELEKLAGSGVTPAMLLGSAGAGGAVLSAEVVARAQHVIAGGLTWVFVAMLGVVVVQLGVTFLMPSKRAGHAVSAREGLEAMG
jgi:hypothetical protein